MDALANLGDSLKDLIFALADVVIALAVLARPWIPLVAWMAFWMFAVDWEKLYPVLFGRGGLFGVMLICLMAVLIWGEIAPGTHDLFGLTDVNNYIGKTVYVVMLVCITWLCGSLQLSGCCSRFCQFEQDMPESGDAH